MERNQLPICTDLPIYPIHRLFKARSAIGNFGRLAASHEGYISFAELDARIQGWINHVGHADSCGLRSHILETLPIRPAEHRRAIATRQNRTVRKKAKTALTRRRRRVRGASVISAR